MGVVLIGFAVGVASCQATGTGSPGGSAASDGPSAMATTGSPGSASAPIASGFAVAASAGATASATTAASATSAAAATTGSSGPVRFVALGDSYTIGTSVAAADRWPDQLVQALGGRVELVANLGVNGYTSGDVIARELPQLDSLAPQFVTLLIGVNDVVQGVPEARYRANVILILDQVRARVPAGHVVAVSTPDYTVTPQGAAFGDPGQQSAGIRRNNDILHELATARGIAFVDIYDISLGAGANRTLVARDGLHPSGTQYGLWVERIAPVVARLLGGSAPGYP